MAFWYQMLSTLFLFTIGLDACSVHSQVTICLFLIGLDACLMHPQVIMKVIATGLAFNGSRSYLRT